MQLLRTIALSSYLLGSAAGRTLFSGRQYVGSAEQHAELDAISEEVAARRAAYAAAFKTTNTTIDVTEAVNKHSNVSTDALDSANRLVDAAIQRWASTYEPYVTNPRPNLYKSQQAGPSRRKPRSSRAGSSRLTARDAAEEDAVLAAAALLAEVDAADRVRNGQLHRNYTLKQPDASFEAWRRGSGSGSKRKRAAQDAGHPFWLEQMASSEHGHAPYAKASGYKVFRNVKDYGAKGDGVTDDTAAINKAITDGKRCGADCLSDTTTPALVYFPNGTYLVSSTIVGLYQTQLVGDPNNRATIRASAKFVGKDGTTGIISSDVYIDGGGGQKWYLETSNFYRQVRNLIIDIIDVKAVNASCLHWQVAQATSLENVACYMSAAKDTTQRGIFCENGSGGWMADLDFANGQIGVYGGEQQFTAVAMYFEGCKTAAQFIWDWGWTWQGIYVGDADVAFKLFDDGGARGVGSFLLQDATIVSCSTGILTLPVKDGSKSGTTNIVLDTVAFSGVSRPVADTSGKVLLSGGDPLEILDAWTVGNDYVQGDTSTNTGGSTLFTSGTHVSSNRLKVLTGGDTGEWSSKWYLFQRKPQYEDIDINSWVNVKDYGAKGDGVTDDTQAFKAIFSYVGQKFDHIFIPHGVYLISDTIYVGGGFDVVGECWSQLMAKGSSFSGLSQPKVFIQVGISGGEVGGVTSFSDLIITTQGTASHFAGVEWNTRGPIGGEYPGMYDVHFRIGGATGTNMQVDQCPQGTGTDCKAGLMLMRVTPSGGGYFQNVWVWVADHDIDDPFNDRINILVARGWLIESTAPTFLYGTASEHSVMYQYSFSGASTLKAGMIQTESAYFQGKDGLGNPGPFTGSAAYPGDPVLPDGGCGAKGNGTAGCDESWAVVILNSTKITIDGAGLYSWFDAYDESCVDSWNCQQSLVQIGHGSGDLSIKNLVTIGATDMVSGVSGESFLGIGAEENLNSVGHPWWSLLSNFQIVGTVATTNWPANRNFFGLGDSFAAGIGADCGDITEDQPEGAKCFKCKGAYPYQLANNFPPFNGGAGSHKSIFKFFACSGAKTGGIVDPPDAGKNSQVKQMKDYGNFKEFGFATLSIGGNNVGFSRIVQKCIFWTTKECDSEMTRTQNRIDSAEMAANLTQSYTQIMDLATVPNFKLFVTGYGRFFNEHTDWCNKKNIFPYTIPFKWRADLTKELRTKCNTMTTNLNTRISAIVKAVNQQYIDKGSQKRVYYVDTDETYETNRWCDGLDRKTWRDDVFFFNINSDDYKPDGTVVSGQDGGGNSPVVIDLGGIDTATCLDAADDAGDMALMFRCALAQLYVESGRDPSALNVVYAAEDGGGASIKLVDSGKFTASGAVLDRWAKAFHPKTYPLANIAGRIYQNWMSLH